MYECFAFSLLVFSKEITYFGSLGKAEVKDVLIKPPPPD